MSDEPIDPDDFLDKQVPPLSDSEKVEMLLDLFNLALHTKSTDELRRFRRRCLEMHRGTEDQTVVIEVIDGLLALREMNGGT